MKRILSMLALLALSCAAMADDPQPETAKTKAIEQALVNFCGTWEIVAMQPSGATKAKSLIFRKDQTYSALGSDGQELWGGTFDLDPTVSPKVWDHRSTESQKQGGDALGIYELDGDKLKICCVVGTWKDRQWKGKPRPAEFRTPAADAVLELRRIPAAR